MARWDDNTGQGAVYSRLSLALGGAVKMTEVTLTHLLCMTSYFCWRTHVIFYSSLNFNTFLRMLFSYAFFANFSWHMVCHCKSFSYVIRDKKYICWIFVPMSWPLAPFSHCLYISPSLFSCLCSSLPFLISSRSYTICVFIFSHVYSIV